MRIHLLAVGTRLPAWVNTAYQEYANRMPHECRLQLTEIAAAKRTKNSVVERLLADECERILAAIPNNIICIALAINGRSWSTEQLSQRLSNWLSDGRDLVFIIGGPDGLAEPVLKKADLHWSLSALTFPHPLVRVMVAEQLYRAWSLLKNHPYHRA